MCTLRGGVCTGGAAAERRQDSEGEAAVATEWDRRGPGHEGAQFLPVLHRRHVPAIRVQGGTVVETVTQG